MTEKSVMDRLAEVQGGIKPLDRKPDAKNAHFNNAYLSLGQMQAIVSPLLAAAGLAMVQTCRIEGDRITVTTGFHAGTDTREFESVIPYVGGRANPQADVSATTYARRLALSCVFGLSPWEDDDGNAASPPPAKAAEAGLPGDDAPKKRKSYTKTEVAAVAKEHDMEVVCEITAEEAELVKRLRPLREKLNPKVAKLSHDKFVEGLRQKAAKENQAFGVAFLDAAIIAAELDLGLNGEPNAQAV